MLDFTEFTGADVSKILDSLFRAPVAPAMIEPNREFNVEFPNWETEQTWKAIPNRIYDDNSREMFRDFWGLQPAEIRESGMTIVEICEYEIDRFIKSVHEDVHQDIVSKLSESSFERLILDFSGPFARIDIKWLAEAATDVWASDVINDEQESDLPELTAEQEAEITLESLKYFVSGKFRAAAIKGNIPLSEIENAEAKAKAKLDELNKSS